MEGKKMYLAHKFCKDEDIYDPNTINGCLNRIERIMKKEQETLSEKYNLNPKDDITAWIFWKLQEASFWPSDEIDYSRLKDDYINASPAIQNAVDLINGWFAGGDGIIIQNIAFRFSVEARSMNEKSALLTQMRQEVVHAVSYMNTITSMIPDLEHRQKILRMADNLKCVKEKEQLMEAYMKNPLPKGYRIVAFACAEGISFWASFDVIFWLKSQGMFITLADLNELIAKDEGMHRDYACARFRELPENDKPSYNDVLTIVKEFVEIEYEFADAVAGPLEKEGHSLTPTTMKKFIRYMANNLLIGLGFKDYFEDAEFPSYMRNISSSQKSNFYEVNVGAYQQFSVEEHINNQNNFDDDDFDIDDGDF